MTSNLEIIIVHRPDGPGAMHEKSPEFLDSMKYVNSQKGCRSTQWGRALNDPSVTICIYDWDELEAYHTWQKESHYKDFREWAFALGKSPSAGIPPLEIRHITIPSEKLQEIFAKPVLEIVMEGSEEGNGFTTKVVEGYGEGKPITIRGLDSEEQGSKSVGGSDGKVFKVKLVSS